MSEELPNIGAVRRIELAFFQQNAGDLSVMEVPKHVPFAIARVFFVRAQAGEVRGRHAHKVCSQLMTCPIGSVSIACDDGRDVTTFVLDRPDVGLLIPPCIWAEQTYVANGSVLMVLCDQVYDAEEYIRDYAEFTAFRRAGEGP